MSTAERMRMALAETHLSGAKVVDDGLALVIEDVRNRSEETAVTAWRAGFLAFASEGVVPAYCLACYLDGWRAWSAARFAGTLFDHLPVDEHCPHEVEWA